MKILLVEDQALVRGALKALLNMEQGIEVIAQAEDGACALDCLKTYDSDIEAIVTDIEMPNVSGLELSEYVKENYPDIKVLIVTTFGKAGYIKRALSLGVDGFILKDAPSEELSNALRQIQRGQKVVAPELAIAALGDNDPLSNKERKALKLAADGITTTAIAAQLFLSEGTVRNYLSSAISKLNATNRVDAARIAHQKGWL